MLLLTGDRNAKGGNIRKENILRVYGLGSQNEAGEELTNFCPSRVLFCFYN